jgi:hypothetical protein
MYRGEITMTAAEFALFFEGANLEARFISPPGAPPMVESPVEIKKSFLIANGELQTAAM